MKKVKILYTRFTTELPEEKFKEFFNRLPSNLQEKNNKFLRWQDKHANLFGKLLLIEGLKKYGYNSNCLEKIQYNVNNRPFIDTKTDFNISHSGEYVICVIAEDIKLGIDIEKIGALDFTHFDSVMTTKQMNHIAIAKDSLKMFFNYWTIKESVIKADGRGLEIPLLDIEINSNIVTFNSRKWFLKNIKIDQNYSCHLAVDKLNINMDLMYMKF